ncbi:leukocyte-specific transcript 1 protein isoform X3 [Ursus americanus]|uniref:leukocyte-specific transcript 1 protein isoform X3 n=1 Tax=Ursus americanus TaxID=9643 RepID=UPI001E67A159|nr:leukocyte-specific transcript 1 protein isoform X3 [Ursus americanus]
MAACKEWKVEVYALTYMAGAWGWGGSCSWLWSLCQPVCVGSIGKREALPQPQGRCQRGPQHRLCLHCQELSHWRSPSCPPEPRRTLWSTQ